MTRIDNMKEYITKYLKLQIYQNLSGSVDKQAVEVTNCFCVPHKEYEDHVEAELQYAQDMFELNKKVNVNMLYFATLHSGHFSLQ